MRVDVKVPPLPESVADATLINWRKRPGDVVEAGENLVDLETDKVTLDVPAPQGGVLKEIRRGDDETVHSGEVIAVIDTAAGVPAGAVEQAPAQAPTEGAQAPAQPPGEGAQARAQIEGEAPRVEGPDTAKGPPQGGDRRPKLSPSVRRLLLEHGLRAEEVPASEGGRLTREDVERFIETERAGSPAPARASSAAPAAPGPEPAGTARAERREPMSRLRRRIAERLVAVQQESAILTTFNEIDMRHVIEVRARYRESFERTHGVKLGFMSFFVAAVVEALQRFSVINASIEGDQIVYHDYCDIGIAVSSPRGLVVPVLRDAEHMNMAQIEAAIADFAHRARENRLDIEDLSGGTFTITNGGVFGSLLSTPILNPPQSGILGMHKIQERPVAESGQVVIRPMMYVALSYDHRLIDGRDAVQFLVAVKALVEDPQRIMLQV